MAREMMECPEKDVVSADRSRCGGCNQGGSGEYPFLTGLARKVSIDTEVSFIILSIWEETLSVT
ncbi:MAG: hypothetical protein ACMUIL_01225 [bacterium]